MQIRVINFNNIIKIKILLQILEGLSRVIHRHSSKKKKIQSKRDWLMSKSSTLVNPALTLNPEMGFSFSQSNPPPPPRNSTAWGWEREIRDGDAMGCDGVDGEDGVDCPKGLGHFLLPRRRRARHRFPQRSSLFTPFPLPPWSFIINNLPHHIPSPFPQLRYVSITIIAFSICCFLCWF